MYYQSSVENMHFGRTMNNFRFFTRGFPQMMAFWFLIPEHWLARILVIENFLLQVTSSFTWTKFTRCADGGSRFFQRTQ